MWVPNHQVLVKVIIQRQLTTTYELRLHQWVVNRQRWRKKHDKKHGTGNSYSWSLTHGGIMVACVCVSVSLCKFLISYDINKCATDSVYITMKQNDVHFILTRALLLWWNKTMFTLFWLEHCYYDETKRCSLYFD